MKKAAIIGVIVIIGIGALLWVFRNNPLIAPLLGTSSQGELINKVAFACDQNKTVSASFYKGNGSIGSVALELSDSRKMTLLQTVSGSGARYANKDETIIFWNKGTTAFITEGSAQQETFSNCVTADASGNPSVKTYASSTIGVSLQYPQAYTLSEEYAYDQFGPKKLVHGISLTIPAAIATGTNLSSDTRLSVEQLPRALKCTADIFIPANVKAAQVDDNGVTYSVASTSGVGAGNLYEEIVYALPTSKPCTAVRYLIHSSNIGNYPEGTVHEFDRASLFSEFDTIRHSLKVGGTATSTN